MFDFKAEHPWHCPRGLGNITEDGGGIVRTEGEECGGTFSSRYDMSILAAWGQEIKRKKMMLGGCGWEMQEGNEEMEGGV